MATIKQEKGWAITRIKIFTKKLEEASEAFDIEAATYTIMRIAQHAFNKMHKINKEAK